MQNIQSNILEKGKVESFTELIRLQDQEQTLNPLSAIPTKRSNTLKQFVGNLPTNCLSVFDHFVSLALKVIVTVTDSIIFTTMRVKHLFLTLAVPIPDAERKLS